MSKGKRALVIAALFCSIASVSFAGELKDDWSDFLHYTKIGRFDLAKNYAQIILDSNPDPVALLNLTLDNPQGFDIMLRVHKMAPDADLAALTEKVIAVIEEGRFVRRADPKIIVDEVARLSSTERGRRIALNRLQEAGEYAIPFMLDAIADPDRQAELAHVVWALPQIGQQAVRPLAAALNTDNSAVKAEVIRALGQIGYPQCLAHLKYVMENDASSELKGLATEGIQKIDPATLSKSSAELYFALGEKYYYHHESLGAQSKGGLSPIWFWDKEKSRLAWKQIGSSYFHELMAMRCGEWSLKADASFGRAIGLWLASFYKAEATGKPMPAYFGEKHADAFVYATTAGPEYLHQALARGLDDKNPAVALGAAEALIVTAGPKSIFVPVGSVQPLLKALTFADNAVRYSAAIAIATAGPRVTFGESGVVVANLAEALSKGAEASADDNARAYALRAVQALAEVAQGSNDAFDLATAQAALVEATLTQGPELKVLAAQTLAYVESPAAQRAIATMSLEAANAIPIRIAGFEALAISGKYNANMLEDGILEQMYTLLQSDDTDPSLRTAAATAFGALSLPSVRVKDLILDQAKI
jgi:hypothetical protein